MLRGSRRAARRPCRAERGLAERRHGHPGPGHQALGRHAEPVRYRMGDLLVPGAQGGDAADRQGQGHGGQAGAVAPVHVGPGRPAGQQAVHDRQRPGQVGDGVDGAPRPRPSPGEPAAREARDDDEDEQVPGDRAQADVERPVPGQERDDSVDGMRTVGHDLQHDMRGQCGQRSQRDAPVHRLRHHPVTGPHDNAVGGQQADADGGRQRDQREDTRVGEQELLHAADDRPAVAGALRDQDQGDGRDDDDEPGGQPAAH